jgi:K+-transporting ATPase KdpF subunit
MASPANASEETAMILDYMLGGFAATLILVYLVYALLRPERF